MGPWILWGSGHGGDDEGGTNMRVWIRVYCRRKGRPLEVDTEGENSAERANTGPQTEDSRKVSRTCIKD